MVALNRHRLTFGKSIIAVLALSFLFGAPVLLDAQGVITKRPGGKEDLLLWDGASPTETALTSTGRTMTLHTIDWVGIDVSAVYGAGAQTSAVITAAMTALGTTDPFTLWLSAGTWTLSADLTITSNFTLAAPAGCIIDVDTYTLTIQGPFEAGLYRCFDVSGGGVVFFDRQDKLFPQWYTDGTVAEGLELLLASHIADYGHPLNVVLQGTTDKLDWDREVVVNRDGNFSLTGNGRCVLANTESIDRFLDLGITKKLNFSEVSGINFRAETAVTEAVRIASASRTTLRDLNFSNGDAGSFVSGVTVDPSAHTGDDGSSGFVGCVFRNLFTGGDGTITGATFLSHGGQVDTLIENIRGAENPAVRVELKTGRSFQSNTIRQTFGTPGDGNGMVELDTDDGDVIGENNISNFYGTGDYALKVKQAGTGIIRDNNVGPIKVTDWDVQAIYVEDSTDTEMYYKATYIIRNRWGNGAAYDTGRPYLLEYYKDAAWTALTTGRGIWYNKGTEGCSVWDSENGTLWHYQEGAWDASPFKIKITIADDYAARILVPARTASAFFVFVAGEDADDDDDSGMFFCRADATAAHITTVKVGTYGETSTGALTGTDGSDDKWTISPHTDGYLYIENRRGGTWIGTIIIP